MSPQAGPRTTCVLTSVIRGRLSIILLFAAALVVGSAPSSWAQTDDAQQAVQATQFVAELPGRSDATQQTSFPIPFRQARASTKPLPLAASKRSNTTSESRASATSPSLVKTFSSWAIVLGLFLVLLWVLRGKLPQATRRLPTAAVELLGRTTVGPRQELQLVRVGSKLLLLGSTNQGLTTLTEIVDPAEVEQLEQACRDGSSERPTAVSHSVRQVLSRFDETVRRTGAACLAFFLLLQTTTGWSSDDLPSVLESSPRTTITSPQSLEAAIPAVLESTQQLPSALPSGWPTWLLLSALSVAPAILLMTTCFVRITVVLSILRQAIGLPQLPPTQVLTSLSVFLTVLVMTPVWTDIYEQAIVPYRDKQNPISLEEVWTRGVGPLRNFMSRQIDAAGNGEDVWLFYQYARPNTQAEPTTYDEVPLQVLLPAFLLSELKVAFLIGFQIYLPFLVVDLVTAAVTTAMGMVMLPPAMISLPLKLLLFVLLNGWHLVVGMLLQSIAPYS